MNTKSTNIKPASVNKSESAMETSTAAEPADKMEQIRELMFGGTVRDFERRLRDILGKLDAETNRLSADFDAHHGCP